MSSPKRRLWYLVAVAAVVWIVWLWDLSAHHAALGHAEPHAQRDVRAATNEPAASQHEKRAAPTRVTMPALGRGDLIASVNVDQLRPCAGESFLVSIRGKPENAGSPLPIAELNFNIGGTFGDKIALSTNSVGTQRYTVVASNGIDKVEHRTFEVEVLPPEARQCQTRAFLTLAAEPSKHDPDQVFARVVAQRGLDSPLHYDWDFGDGSSSDGDAANTSHSYALRDQQRTLSSYVITVHARDARGRTAQGRATIHLMNNQYRARMFGARLVQTVYNHFPAATANSYRADVTFRSFEPEPVILEDVKVTERSCLAGQGTRTQQLSVAELGVSLRLEPSRATKASLMLPRALLRDDVCAVELELVGDTRPAHTGEPMASSPIKLKPVTARIVLEIKAAPSVEHGGAATLAQRPVQNAELLKKLRRASAILGSDRVTPTQLEALERDGRLAP